MKIQHAVIEATQDVPDSFLRDLADRKIVQDAVFAADDIQICSLPGALVDAWYRAGFSVWDQNVTPQDIIKRLISEDLTKFLTTSKSFG